MLCAVGLALNARLADHFIYFFLYKETMYRKRDKMISVLSHNKANIESVTPRQGHNCTRIFVLRLEFEFAFIIGH